MFVCFFWGVVFVIKLEAIDEKFILYLWDSFKNLKDKEKLLPYFDKAFSFDSYNVKKYDLCFIGIGHSDRYKLVKTIQNEAKKLGLNTYSFFFLESKKIFLFRKIFDARMRKAPIEDFSFKPLNQQEILDYMMESHVVIDIEHPGQVGLTMRTIEMIGCEKN